MVAGRGQEIFISYGRDCAQIVLRIKNNPENAGYQVWLDTECIRPGQDWRGEITKAILQADIIFAFAPDTKTSPKSDNECLQNAYCRIKKCHEFLLSCRLCSCPKEGHKKRRSVLKTAAVVSPLDLQRVPRAD